MAINGLNILFTTAHFPFPLIGGERIKQYHLIKHLAENNNVYLLSFDRGYEVKEEYLQEIRKIGAIPFAVHLDIRKAYINGLLFSPFGNPLEIEFFRNGKFRNHIDEIRQKNKIGLYINFFLRTAEFVRNIPGKKILVAEDCRTLYQQRTSGKSSNLKERLIRLYESKKMSKYEKDVFNDFDVTTFVTDRDAAEAGKLNNKADIRVLSNGVDTQIYYPAGINTDKEGLIFFGKLDVWVNQIMLDRIISNIFPAILNRLPGTKLKIVGANPSDDLLKRASENIEICRDVPDIIPYIQKAKVFIHPHSGGSGIQNKVLEAMACGCPVITTNSGSRGIDIRDGINGFIAETDEEIAEKACRLLSDTALAEKTGKEGRKLVINNHSWESIYSVLDGIIEELN